jgi:hypothetical protein
VVLRSAWLDLLEKEEAAGGKDLPPLLTVQKSLLQLFSMELATASLADEKLIF